MSKSLSLIYSSAPFMYSLSLFIQEAVKSAKAASDLKVKNLEDRIEFLEARLEQQSCIADRYEQQIVNLKCELETNQLKFENEVPGQKECVKLGRDLHLELQDEIHNLKEKEVKELKRLLETKTSKISHLEKLANMNEQFNRTVNLSNKTRVKDLEKIIEALKFELEMKAKSMTFLRICKKDLEMEFAGLEKKLLQAEVKANIMKAEMNSAADSVNVIAKDLSAQVLALTEEKAHLLKTDEKITETKICHCGFLSEIDSDLHSSEVRFRGCRINVVFVMISNDNSENHCMFKNVLFLTLFLHSGLSKCKIRIRFVPNIFTFCLIVRCNYS